MSNRGNLKITTALVSFAGFISLPFGAYAQTQQTAAGGGLEEIIVTAQRVDSTLQQTPIAVTALSADTLETRQVFNIEDAAHVIPGVVITPAASTSNSARIVMRGAGQENSGILYDPAVGVYIDNIYQPRINGQFFDFFDIDRLEVLRGPQGTLYGRNTISGAIKIVSRTPSFTPTYAGDLAYGNFNSVEARAYISAGITDNLAASLSAVERKREGWVASPMPTPTRARKISGNPRTSPQAEVITLHPVMPMARLYRGTCARCQ